MKIPLIEEAKLQARVLVPLVKALQAELGEERANELVRKALGDYLRQRGETWWKTQGQRGPLGLRLNEMRLNRTSLTSPQISPPHSR